MINYKVKLNQGNEAFNTGKTITAEEVVKEIVSSKEIARELHHLNSLIPEQVAEAVVDNLLEAFVHEMAHGREVQLKRKGEVYLRLYADVKLGGDGNINLTEAQALMEGVSDLTTANAGEIATAYIAKKGLNIKAHAQVMQKFSEAVNAEKDGVERVGVEEKAFVPKREGGNGSGSGQGGNQGGNGGDDDPDGGGALS